MSITKKTPTLVTHTIAWVFFLVINITYTYFRKGSITPDFGVRFFILILAFYLNYCFFVPKLLLQKKIYVYIATLIAFSIAFVYILGFLHFKESVSTSSGIHKDSSFLNPNDSSFIFDNFFLPETLLFLIIALGTSVRLGVEWYKVEKQKALIEVQKVNSELSFLKTQLNPHFLFNSLNSIYSLAHKQSKDTTNAIVILSELMRYMIYEATEELVPLQKEVEYIKNYISLQLLRLKDSSGIKVNIHGNLNYKIEPLLLISFIENAFKYGTDFQGNTIITIKIGVEEDILNLHVYNVCFSQKPKDKNSGIGLENIKNRLNLLYKNNYSLEINSHKKSYEVNLTLKLKK